LYTIVENAADDTGGNEDVTDDPIPDNNRSNDDTDLNLDGISDSGSEAPADEDDVMSADDSQSSEQSSPLLGTGAQRRKRRLFTIHHVNSYGTAEVDRLSDDGTTVKFASMSQEHSTLKTLNIQKKIASVSLLKLAHCVAYLFVEKATRLVFRLITVGFQYIGWI